MKRIRICALLLAILASGVYLATLEPTVSFWDCGEFIATSYTLQVPHPPGAPLYQLIAHLFALLAGGAVAHVAWWCNALSALSAGVTALLLYLTAERMAGTYRSATPRIHVGAVTATLCWIFSHSVWFSAVESEVYSLAMLVAAAMVWSVWCWRDAVLQGYAGGRWILLLALLTGMGVCVHQLTLLVLPMAAVVVVVTLRGRRLCWPRALRCALLALLLFVAGLSPYLIVPLRAAGHPPINFENPDTAARFRAYLTRERYEQAPLWPRMWRHRRGDDMRAAQWSGGTTEGVGPNLRYYATYQLGYMYGRYLIDNFFARENERSGRVVWFVIPLLLALTGCMTLWHRSRLAFVATLLLFFCGGPLLNFYLNHPCYEPRERDYAYLLSFYAVALWIAEGSSALLVWGARRLRPLGRRALIVVLLAAPLTMAAGNWSDHDRSGRYVARDVAANMLASCDRGALLVTYGDNDTFPLWYLQQVEGVRTDVRCVNVNLAGLGNTQSLIKQMLDADRSCYLSQYAYDALAPMLCVGTQLEGLTYRVVELPVDTVDTEAFARHLHAIEWHDTTGVFLDLVSRDFLRQYDRNMERYRQALEKSQTR